ncbi:hypothetical protein CBM2633_A10299 [Cupriavidus taiwanensis]|nr:hypothetical protein CBM2633_A10299 [Cupriavidus taiwanensis]
MAAHGAFALGIPRGDGDAGDGATRLTGQLLDGVGGLLAMGAVVTDAVGACGFGILVQMGAVSKDQHRVPMRRFHVLDHGVPKASLRHKPGQKVVVGLTELRDMRPLAGRTDPLQGARGIAPACIGRVRAQHLVDDADERTLLEHLAVALLGGQPQPRHHGQAVARQAAIGTQLLGLAYEPGALRLAAAGQCGRQRQALPKKRIQRQGRIGADGDDAPFEDFRDGFAANPGLDRQRVEWAGAVQRIEAVGRGKQVPKQSCGVHSTWMKSIAGKGTPLVPQSDTEFIHPNQDRIYYFCPVTVPADLWHRAGIRPQTIPHLAAESGANSVAAGWGRRYNVGFDARLTFRALTHEDIDTCVPDARRRCCRTRLWRCIDAGHLSY